MSINYDARRQEMNAQTNIDFASAVGMIMSMANRKYSKEECDRLVASFERDIELISQEYPRLTKKLKACVNRDDIKGQEKYSAKIKEVDAKVAKYREYIKQYEYKAPVEEVSSELEPKE